MDRETRACFRLVDEKNISLRTAAYLRGVEQIAGAISERGTQAFFTIVWRNKRTAVKLRWN